MRVSEAIKKRKSIRAFKNKKISKAQLEKLIEAARLAPSAKNLQPYFIVIVEEQKLKEELAKACHNQNFIAGAGLVFVGLADTKFSKWAEIDLTIAFEHVVLQATELGLGSCWVEAFDENAVKRIVGAPEHLKLVAVLPVGFPAENPRAIPKKPINEIFSFNNFWGRE